MILTFIIKHKNQFVNRKTIFFLKNYQLVHFALDDIVARIVQNEVITGAAEFRIWKLQQLGIHPEKIKDYIKKMTKFSD